MPAGLCCCGNKSSSVTSSQLPLKPCYSCLTPYNLTLSWTNVLFSNLSGVILTWSSPSVWKSNCIVNASFPNGIVISVACLGGGGAINVAYSLFSFNLAGPCLISAGGGVVGNASLLSCSPFHAYYSSGSTTVDITG